MGKEETMRNFIDRIAEAEARPLSWEERAFMQLSNLREGISQGRYERTGYCMCGSEIKGHGPDNHRPLDESDYFAQCSIEAIEALTYEYMDTKSKEEPPHEEIMFKFAGGMGLMFFFLLCTLAAIGLASVADVIVGGSV